MKDINADLYRKTRTKKSTIGELFIDGVFFCYTLEDVDRGWNSETNSEQIKKEKAINLGDNCIPSGTYEVIMTYSESRKRKMPMLIGVKGFKSILIHIGNFIKDTLGCILVGDKVPSAVPDKIEKSTDAFNRLIKKIELHLNSGARMFITIHN